MISPSSYRQFNGFFTQDISQPVQKDEMTEEQLLICSPIVYGFAFERKSWGALR